MKSEKALLIAAALALGAGAAAAQSDLGAAYDSARAAVAAGKAVRNPPPANPDLEPASAAHGTSCADARELETSFELTVTFANGMPARELHFTYAGCREAGRNDYQPPYTERDYTGDDGYALTIVTDDGDAESEVLLSKGKDWVGRFGKISNVSLTTGESHAAGDVTVKESWGPVAGKATIRDSAKPQYPQLAACEKADWSKTGTTAPARDAYDKPATGWEGRLGPSLVLLTKSAAYYYYESCDICADMVRCDLASGGLTAYATAHSLDCGDLRTPRSQPDVVYDACAPLKP